MQYKVLLSLHGLTLLTSVSPTSNLMPPELLISQWNIKSCYAAALPGATMWNTKYQKSKVLMIHLGRYWFGVQ